MATHTVSADNVVEVWYKGEFICAVYGADGPGVRIISKHPVTTIAHHGAITTEVMLDTTQVIDETPTENPQRRDD
jgi:hypothetical protein